MFRPLALPTDVAGALWLHAMPGRFEPWNDFLAEAARRRLDRMLCLTSLDEVAALSPPYAQAIGQGTLPCRWEQLVMRNFGPPLDEIGLRERVQAVAAALAGGESVLVHCAAGIGRTGTVAACVLKQLGWPVHQALQAVIAAGSNPQNAEQTGLIHRF
jgi:protein tyrosine phosphatase